MGLENAFYEKSVGGVDCAAEAETWIDPMGVLVMMLLVFVC